MGLSCNPELTKKKRPDDYYKPHRNANQSLYTIHLRDIIGAMTITSLDNELATAFACGEFLNLKDASRFAGVNYLTYRKRVLREELPVLKIRGRVYLRKSDALNPLLKVS